MTVADAMTNNEFTEFCFNECKTPNYCTFLYSLNATSQKDISKYITCLKEDNHYTIFIFDCALYYNDIELYEGLKKMEEKKGTLMASFMMDDECFKRKNNVLQNYNLVFVENVDTFDDAKNLFQFINTLISKQDKKKHTHYYFVINNLFQDPVVNDLYLKDKILNPSDNHEKPLFFKNLLNYKHFQAYKTNMFPLNKIKLNKAKTIKVINNVYFVSSTRCDIKTIQSQKKVQYSDYKDALVEFLRMKTYEFTRIISINHPENIPMIVYENIHVFFKTVREEQKEGVYQIVRELCLNYYKHVENPDNDLFKTNNLKYFLFKTKQLMSIHGVSLSSSNHENVVDDIVFTKYYSNRAAEIQCHKRFYNSISEEIIQETNETN